MAHRALCWLCGAPLRIQVTRSRKGRLALGFACSADGRHVRGFINERRFLDEVLGDTPDLRRSSEALQNRFETALARRPKEQSTTP